MADYWEVHREKLMMLFLEQGKTLDQVTAETEASGFYARFAAEYSIRVALLIHEYEFVRLHHHVPYTFLKNTFKQVCSICQGSR